MTVTGLRERKKQKTHEDIRRAAMKLFNRRGFDAVTVAEVAEAAGVSVKTVFNYFPAKEDLVFPNSDDRWAATVAGIRARPAGASVLHHFRSETDAFLDLVAKGPVEEIIAVPRLVTGSTALRDRLSVWWEREAALLAPILAEEAGDKPGDLAPLVVARTLAWTHRVTFRAAFTRLIAGEDQRKVARDLRRQARRAYDLLEDGLADYGRSAHGRISDSS